MPLFNFKNWNAGTIEIYGEAYLLKIREGRFVIKSHPCCPCTRV